MLRNILGWILLVPMLLNGLWVVCEDVPSAATAAPVSQEVSEQAAHCASICAKLRSEVDICFLLPGDSKKSVTVVDFGAAVVTPEIQLQPPTNVEEFVAELPVSYSIPSLSNNTPPPKA